MAKPSRPSTAAKARTGNRKAQATENKEQSARFIEAARELEADENGEAFNAALGRILPPKRPG
jgi:hypothetical protein